MKRLFLLLFLAALGYGGWTYWKGKPDLKLDFLNSFTRKEFSTFKVRFTAESIMERHRKELLKRGGEFLEPQLTYFPYLLMEVKYASNEKKTNEGMLLWGLIDGEMVTDVENWEKTHGFEDCLMADVNEKEFQILRLLAQSEGIIERSKLSKESDEGVEGCKEKKLVVEMGSRLRLHLQNPKLETEPHTELGEWVVTLKESPKRKEGKRYTTGEIVKLSQIAFGEDFAIRREKEVYLPVHEIGVTHEDGSIMRTYWNALTGKQIEERL